MIDGKKLLEFGRESNKIEGIGVYTSHEQEAYVEFLDLPFVQVGDFEKLNSVIQPGARLRRHPGMDVRVGSHVPPRGGTHIEAALMTLLDEAEEAFADPYEIHCKYEHLHPFMDGNGRTGRALWLWMMIEHKGVQPETFLHQWYYQSLQAHHEG